MYLLIFTIFDSFLFDVFARSHFLSVFQVSLLRESDEHPNVIRYFCTVSLIIRVNDNDCSRVKT